MTAPDQQLARLVQQMRAAQRRYFKSQTPDALAEARSLERKVDRQVAAVLDPRNQTPMFPMFGE